jgi:hypothetical protein
MSTANPMSLLLEVVLEVVVVVVVVAGLSKR